MWFVIRLRILFCSKLHWQYGRGAARGAITTKFFHYSIQDTPCLMGGSEGERGDLSLNNPPYA